MRLRDFPATLCADYASHMHGALKGALTILAGASVGLEAQIAEAAKEKDDASNEPRVALTEGDRLELSAGPRFGSDEHQRLGVGARAGFGLTGGFYLGAMFDYFMGSNEARTLNNASGDVSFRSWTFLIEPGVDFAVIDNLMARVFVGIGTSNVTIKSTLDDSEVDDSNFTAEAGALLHYDLGVVFAGPELRMMFGDGNDFVGAAHVGMAF